MHGSIARGPKTLENLHLSDVQELLPTYYLLLTTYYSRLTTDYLPLATYYPGGLPDSGTTLEAY